MNSDDYEDKLVNVEDIQNSGSSSIPEPTSEDEGKVISVSSEGKYELSEAGGNIGVINIERTGSNNITVSKTYDEILQLVNDRVLIFVYDYDKEYDGLIRTLADILVMPNIIEIYTYGISLTGSTNTNGLHVGVYKFTIDSNNNITYSGGYKNIT